MIEKKRPQHMSMEIQFLAWDWHKKCIGSKLKNAITTLCLLDDWIYNDNTDINKQKNVCIARRIR
jgi:hypothetical protein